MDVGEKTSNDLRDALVIARTNKNEQVSRVSHGLTETNNSKTDIVVVDGANNNRPGASGHEAVGRFEYLESDKKRDDS